VAGPAMTAWMSGVHPSLTAWRLRRAPRRTSRRPQSRGLHSSTFWLDLSAICGIGGTCGGRLGVLKGELRGTQGYAWRILCQKGLRLS